MMESKRLNFIPRELLEAVEPGMEELTLHFRRFVESVALDFWRCPKCGTLLAKVRLMPGSVIEIKCYRCKAIVKEAA